VTFHVSVERASAVPIAFVWPSGVSVVTYVAGGADARNSASTAAVTSRSRSTVKLWLGPCRGQFHPLLPTGTVIR